MKLTPLAPAYYVLALSLIGLMLGLYLHRDLNSEAGGGEPIPTAKKSPALQGFHQEGRLRRHR